MNTLSKILLIYCSLVAILIVGSLFLGKGNLYLYLILVPLPVYFILFTWGNLVSRKTDIGLSFKKLRFFAIVLIALVLIGFYKLNLTTNTKPEKVTTSAWKVVPIASPQTILIKITSKTKIYQEKSLDSAVLGSASTDDIFVVYEHVDKWYKVNFENGQTGFVPDSAAEILK